MSPQSKKERIKLSYNIPIQETVRTRENLLIRGPAIHATITKNKHKFIAFELEKAAPSLRNKPILIDHINSVESIVGRTTNNIDFKSNRIDFEGKISLRKKEIVSDIEEGLITSVSVGAYVEKAEDVYDKDDNFLYTVLKGIEFVEISLVAVPADPKAGITNSQDFATAVYSAFDEPYEPSQKLHSPKSENQEVSNMSDKKDETSEVEALHAENAKILAENAKLEQEVLKAKQEALIKEKDKLAKVLEDADKPEGTQDPAEGDPEPEGDKEEDAEAKAKAAVEAKAKADAEAKAQEKVKEKTKGDVQTSAPEKKKASEFVTRGEVSGIAVQGDTSKLSRFSLERAPLFERGEF